jgi:TetR/AcrR family transcriptional regulator, mexJK operon transcriptional repressor
VVGKRFAPLTPPHQVPEVALFELGLSLLRLMIRKDAASLFRIAVAEAPRAPKLGAIFYAQGPGTTLKRLAKNLRAAADRGELRCREPLRGAELFLGAVFLARYRRERR